LLHCAAISGCKVTLHYLPEIGANPNDKANGGSSALATAMWNLNFGSIHSFSSKLLRSKYDVYKALECIHELVEHGAIWKPDEPGQFNSVRRALLGCEPAVTAELLGLFRKHNACEPQTVEDLLRSPRMKQHLSSQSWHLSRIGLKPHFQERRQGAAGLQRKTYLRSSFRNLRQKPIKLIKGSFPERLMTCNPSARLFKGFPAQPELMDSPFHLAFHYPSSFQNFQVLGNCGLGGAELPAEFAGAAGLAARQRMNHRTPGAIGKSVES
jgi:hypothetical protein